jgi:MraZ protein
MDLTFRGEYEYAVDDRGRMVIPPKFREALTDTVLIGRGAEGQLWVYPKATFEQRLLEAQQANDAEQDADFDMGQRFWLAANEIEADRQGRLPLPGVLRKQADIGSTVIIVGNGDRVEIWSPARWDQTYSEWVAGYRARRDGFGAMKRSGLRP